MKTIVEFLHDKGLKSWSELQVTSKDGRVVFTKELIEEYASQAIDRCANKSRLYYDSNGKAYIPLKYILSVKDELK